MSGNNGKAVVIGASMAGLLAARALSERFADVTIVDRDTVADVSEPRKGVPQGRHTHALLARGREALEALFPGLSAEAFANGAVRVDLTSDVLWFNHGVYLASAPSGLLGFALSRPRLEAIVRNRLLALPNVRLIENCEAVAPAFDPAQGRVTGLNIQPRGGHQPGRELAADLVVDASGRGSRSPVWLEALGFARPREECVHVDLGYVTAQYRREPGQLPGKNAVVMAGCAPDWRCGAMVGQEDDRWMATLGGYAGDHPPTTPDGFLAFARTLQEPEVFDTLKDAELLSPPTPYHSSANLPDATNASRAFPRAISSSATPCAASTRSMARA